MSVADRGKGSHSGVQKLVIAHPALIARSAPLAFKSLTCMLVAESFVPILLSSACLFSTHAVAMDELQQRPATEWRSSNNESIELTRL